MNDNTCNDDTLCIDINDDWYVKIGLKDTDTNTIVDVKYISICKNLSVTQISDVSDIFVYLILPKPYEDQYGVKLKWEILDRENLYTLEDIDQQYWDKDKNPECVFFEVSGESWINDNENAAIRNFNYFDELVQNL